MWTLLMSQNSTETKILSLTSLSKQIMEIAAWLWVAGYDERLDQWRTTRDATGMGSAHQRNGKNDKFGKLHAKKQEVATELEHEIFASLVNDLICSFRRNGLVIVYIFFSKSNCIACLRGVSSCIRWIWAICFYIIMIHMV